SSKSRACERWPCVLRGAEQSTEVPDTDHGCWADKPVTAERSVGTESSTPRMPVPGGPFGARPVKGPIAPGTAVSAGDRVPTCRRLGRRLLWAADHPRMKDGPARPASLTQEWITRKGLIQNGHATLDDGDPGAGERQVGDRPGPVIVRAPPLG